LISDWLFLGRNFQRGMECMTTAERRISRLEKILERETTTNRAGHNYYRIGYTQFELSQLYKLSGIPAKSKEMLKEALLTLQNPECKKGKKTDKLVNLISFCISNPTAPPFVQLPTLLRYLSPLILMVGYASAYVIYFAKMISYTAFIAIIVGVFISSMLATGLVSSSYMKQIRKGYVSQQPFVPGFAVNSSTSNERTGDDLVDDARAELSLANLYFSTKEFKEMEVHLNKARAFLSDPLTNQSKKKDQALSILDKLESTLQGKKSGDHYNIF
jgi:hypothetical protein